MNSLSTIGLSIIIAVASLIACYNFGYSKGEEYILSKQNSVMLELKEQNHLKELEYTNKIKDLENEIKNSEVNYSNSIAKLNKSNADGLLESQHRAEYYRRQAETCSTQSRTFADYTARLDRQLTEGISLVRELSELIKHRDNQLKQAGEQLKLDRKLME